MNENLWRRMTATGFGRYRRSALAQYGASLDCDCEVDSMRGLADFALPKPRAAVDDRVVPPPGARGQAAQVS